MTTKKTDDQITEAGATELDEGDLEGAAGGLNFSKIETNGVQAPTTEFVAPRTIKFGL